MAKTLSINIKVDAKTGKLVGVSDKFRTLDKQVTRSRKHVHDFNQKLMTIAKSAAGLYVVKKVFDAIYFSAKKFIDDGFKFNSTMENSRAGLMSLAMTMQDQNIPVAQRYATAQREANAAMAELLRINRQTPHTLDQTVQIYKAMYSSMRSAGASSRDIIEITRKVSIAAGAAGVGFRQILASVDGLGTGTIKANSDLGRFFVSLGLTNKALRGTDDIVGLLNDKLKNFKAFDTMKVAVSNLSTEWGQLSGELTIDIFAAVKDSINAASHDMGEMRRKGIAPLHHDINTLAIAAIRAGGAMVEGIGWAVKMINGAEVLIENAGMAIKSIWHPFDDWSQYRAKAEANRQEYMTLVRTLDNVDVAVDRLVARFQSSVHTHETDTIATKKHAASLGVLNNGLDRHAQKIQAVKDKNLEAIYQTEATAAGYAAKTAKDYYEVELKAADALSQVDTAQQTAADSAERLAAASMQSADAARVQAAAIAGVTEVAAGSNVWHVAQSQGMSPAQTGHSTHGAGTTGSVSNDAIMNQQAFSPYTGMRWDVLRRQAEIRDQREERRREEMITAEEKRREQADVAGAKAREDIQRRAEQAERELGRRREAIAREQEAAVRAANAAMEKFKTTLQSIKAGLAKDYASRAREALYGGTEKGRSFAEAKAAAQVAWDAFRADDTNKDLLTAYNNRMDELIGTLDAFKDATRYDTKEQQNWAKAAALHQVQAFQDGQLDQSAAIDAQLEELKKITTHTSTTAAKHHARATGYTEVHGQTGAHVTAVNDHWEHRLQGDGSYKDERVYDYIVVPSFGTTRLHQQIPMYYSGGFTGSGSDHDIAGITHANEYVINAQTTRDLGLNGSQGIFSEMVEELGGIKAAIIIIAQNTGMSASDAAKLLKHEEAKAALGGYEDMAS